MDADEQQRPTSGLPYACLSSAVRKQMHDATISVEAVNDVELSHIPWTLQYIGDISSNEKIDGTTQPFIHFPPWNYLDLRRIQILQVATNQLTEGIKFAKAGREKDAEVCYIKGLELAPDHAELLVAYGALCANLGRFDESIEMLEKAIKVNPQSPNAQSYLDAVRQRQLNTSRNGASQGTKININKYPLVGDDSEHEADVESNVVHRKLKLTRKDLEQECDDELSMVNRKRQRRKDKKRSKRKNTRYDSSSDGESSEISFNRQERKRRKKKHARRK